MASTNNICYRWQKPSDPGRVRLYLYINGQAKGFIYINHNNNYCVYSYYVGLLTTEYATLKLAKQIFLEHALPKNY